MQHNALVQVLQDKANEIISKWPEKIQVIKYSDLAREIGVPIEVVSAALGGYDGGSNGFTVTKAET